MKRIIKLAVITVAILCMIAMSAAAAVVEYNVEEVNPTDGVYKIVATVKNTDGVFATFKSDITFDNSIIVPVSAKTGSVANIAGGTVKTPIKITTYFDEDVEENVEISHSPASPSWKVADTAASLTIETYTTLKTISSDNVMAFEMYFKYADGKSTADLTKDSFVIDYIKYADHVTGIETYNAGADTDTLTVVNNVVPAAPVALTIPVTKGDAIYFANGTMAVAGSTGDYKVPAEDGIIVVNTGYEAQKVYEVANGKLSERTDLADGVLATPGVSIRKDAKATGVRFKSSFLTSLKANVKEYGYIVTVESAKNALPEFGYTLDMALVEAGKAKKGVGYSKEDGTDIFYDVDGARTVVTMVATGIPLTQDAVTTNIVARPYYILENGAVVYGETNTASAYQIACAVRAQGGEIYENNKEYVDAIIALVPSENDGDNIIDTDYLFS